MTLYVLMQVFNPGDPVLFRAEAYGLTQPVGFIPAFDTLEAVQPWNPEGHHEITMMEAEGG